MPTTPTYGLPYPALSDSPNGPSQIGSLATTLDTLFGTFAAADTALTARFTNLLLNNAGINEITTNESRNNVTFGDLATVGPTVTLNSVGTRALVIWGCNQWGATVAQAGRMTAEITGATTLSANVANGWYGSENAGTGVGAAGVTARLFTINPGSNQYRAKYNNPGGGNAFFQNRWLFVFAP